MPTLYLDTSDLSYLVKGRGPAAAGDVVAARDRLEALAREGRLQIVLSLIHLAELAQNAETSMAALAWLDGRVPVWCVRTPPGVIFRAELLGTSLTMQADPLAREDLESLRLPLRVPGVRVRAATLARGVKQVVVGLAAIENRSKRVARRQVERGAKQHARGVREQHRLVERLVRGDYDGLAPVQRAVATAALPILRWWTSRAGLRLEDVLAHRRLPPGCSWFAGTVPPAEWSEAAKRVRSRPAEAPASALRVAIEKGEAGDPGRVTQPGLLYDLHHLAYAARCDFATLDGANYRATATVREQLARPTFFPTARLHEVVEAVERACECPA